MNKEEILRKSQAEKHDEGKEYLNACGRKSGVIGMIIVFLILSVYYLYQNDTSRIAPLLSIIFAYLAFESMGIFMLSKKKIEMIKIGIGLLLCFLFLSLSF